MALVLQKTNSAGYGNIGSAQCSCQGPIGGDGCNDSNCCVMRPIITTEDTTKLTSLLCTSY